MEPRPPRPRGPQYGIPGAPAGVPAAGYPYAPEGAVPANVAPPAAVPLAGEPLLPRQQRRRQGAWRGLLAGLLGLAALGAIAWMLRDRIIPPSAPTTPQAAIQVAPASPAAMAPDATAAPAAANLLSTATPTPSPPPRPTAAPTATPTPRPTETPADAVDGAILPLVDLLPDATEMPAGLVEAGTGERSKGDVVLSLAGDDPVVEAEADRLLADWGWEGNAFRDFGPATAEGTPSGLTVLNVSIHRFADDASADDAMIYFSDRVVAAQGLADVAVEPLGDAVRALAGAPEGAPIAVLYVRDGNAMYRIGGAASPESGADPIPPLIEAATAILAQ